MPKFSSLQVFLGLVICSSLVVADATAKEAPTSQRSEAQVSAWLEKHRNQPPALRAFLQRMPKGGDIHSHLSGAVYTAITMGCGTPSAQPGCSVTIRYLQQTTRTKAPEEVFAQFVYAFKLAKADGRVVGINLVAPGDHPVALRDYTLQMEMLKFLHSQFPSTKISLHAGELTLGLLPPNELRSHIRQAVEIGLAKRIGHGVDVLYEDNPFQLMAEMRRRGVLVEICPTSNEVILNVKGDDHPFRNYLAAEVPLTIASDEEGISRSDLSNEYLIATRRYNLGYKDLNKLTRNSLEYSFLKGESLWQSSDFTKVTAACANYTPGSKTTTGKCSTLLNNSPDRFITTSLQPAFCRRNFIDPKG